MTKIHFTIISLIFLPVSLIADPGGKGKGGMGGPLPAEQREIIHEMARLHDQLTRKVTLIEKGYTATTTSKNKELVTKLKTHLRYMKKRLDSGAMVRRWDPAYAELTEYYPQLTTKIEELPNGLKVTITGKTPKAIKVARNHAKIVSGFVKKGEDALHNEHPTAN